MRTISNRLETLERADLAVIELRDLTADLVETGNALLSLAKTMDDESTSKEGEYLDDLRQEAFRLGIVIDGKYPHLRAHSKRGDFEIRIVEPYQEIIVEGHRLAGATPEKVVAHLQSTQMKIPSPAEGQVNLVKFSKILLDAYKIECVLGGGKIAKLASVLRIARTPYLSRGIKINEIRLFEDCLSKKLVEVAMHPGRNIRDAIPISFGGIKRNVVWVELMEKTKDGH